MATPAPDRTRERREVLVQALRSPDAYPHHVEGPVRLIETHVSHLFLTGEYVYKLKKPVDVGFLDFTTLAKRRHFTYQELELNRRLSPDVYLGVVEVRRDVSGRYRVEGVGQLEEYALKMRELPAETSLRSLIETGHVGGKEIDAIAGFVAGFHATAAAAQLTSQYGDPQTIRRQVLDNLALAGRWAKSLGFGDQLAEISAYTHAFLGVRPAQLAARKAGGWIRDCHGDLHTANIFLERGEGDTPPAVRVIDRIEFSDLFRFIDVTSDIAFLSMDLKFMGRGDLAAMLLKTYTSVLDESSLRDTLPFYEVYRAMVRCKVALLLLEGHYGRPGSKASRPEAALAFRYAKLAAEIVARQRPPALYVMTGVVGTGKSTVARELAHRWGIAHISSDVVRKTLFGLDPHKPSDPAVRDRLYAPRMHLLTYGELQRRGASEIAEGKSVILDASFLKRDHRNRAREIARKYGVPFLVLECRLSVDLARARLERRSATGASESDAGPELLGWQLSQREAVSDSECDGHVVIDTSGDPDDYVAAAQDKIWRSMLALGQKTAD